eukprot:9474148-Lingulodinium_polyedra.AAC.1
MSRSLCRSWRAAASAAMATTGCRSGRAAASATMATSHCRSGGACSIKQSRVARVLGQHGNGQSDADVACSSPGSMLHADDAGDDDAAGNTHPGHTAGQRTVDASERDTSIMWR